MDQDSASWVNVADIVRQTFAFLIDKVKVLHDKVKNMETTQESILGQLNHKSVEEKNAAAIAKLEALYLSEREARLNLERELNAVKLQLGQLSQTVPHKQELSRVLVKKVDTHTLEAALEEFVQREEITVTLTELREKFRSQMDLFQRDLEQDLKLSMENELQFMRIAVTCEMLLARWIFKADRNGLEEFSEIVNTSQMIFESSNHGTPMVRVLRGGIFQVSLACFCNAEREPLIQLVVNNQHVVMSTTTTAPTLPQSPPQGIHTPYPRSKPRISSTTPPTSTTAARNPFSSWSHNEYLTLPANCELAIRYRGEKAHGVLTIRNIHCFE